MIPSAVKKVSQSTIEVAMAALTYIHDHVDTSEPAEDRRRKNPARDPRFTQVFRDITCVRPGGTAHRYACQRAPCT